MPHAMQIGQTRGPEVWTAQWSGARLFDRPTLGFQRYAERREWWGAL